MKPTTKLTKRLRNHLKEIGVRCTVKEIANHIADMRLDNPHKSLVMVCGDCADIARRLNV